MPVSHFPAILLVATLLGGGVAASNAQSTPAAVSPFLPPAGVAPPPEAAATGYEFSGVIVSSRQTLVSITDTTKKRSTWVAVGKTTEGIEVLRHDAKADQVVIKVNNETKTLTLKQPVITAASPGGVSAALGGPASALAQIPLPPLVTREEQEREARMLVSDLLELGMQQRKAYEEAQRKAALEAGLKTAPNPAGAAPQK